ncbi:MAG TPA: ParB/RepB/Spo0J family partition protein [Edaphobacter sp.]|nr:ParB/RepB/Spo0J family partition protein [Edaphobacter sp.]
MSVSKATVREIVRRKLCWFQPKNVRKQFDEQADRQLGESVMKRQIHPVVALADGTIVDGERRWRGAKLVGLEELDVIIVEEELSETALLMLQAATVFHRKDWTPGEKYEFAYGVAMRNPTWQAKEIAEHLHIDPATISKLLSFSKCIPPVRDELKAGNLSMNDGHAFSRLPEAEQAELLPKRLTGEIANREEMVREVRARKKAATNGHRSSVKRFRTTLPFAGVSVVLSGKSLGMPEIINALTELLRLAKKAKQNKVDVQAFERDLKSNGHAGNDVA